MKGRTRSRTLRMCCSPWSPLGWGGRGGDDRGGGAGVDGGSCGSSVCVVGISDSYSGGSSSSSNGNRYSCGDNEVTVRAD